MLKPIVADGTSCGDGYRKITSLSDCRDAVAATNSDSNEWHGSETVDEFPGGCYYCKEDSDDCAQGTWFNHNENGKSNDLAQPYCVKSV